MDPFLGGSSENITALYLQKLQSSRRVHDDSSSRSHLLNQVCREEGQCPLFANSVRAEMRDVKCATPYPLFDQPTVLLANSSVPKHQGGRTFFDCQLHTPSYSTITQGVAHLIPLLLYTVGANMNEILLESENLHFNRRPVSEFSDWQKKSEHV